MVKVETLARELFEGHPVGGINFYFTPGDRVYLYQEWEHMASGPVWGQVTVDPIYKDIITTITESWSDYIIVDVEDNYC